MNIMTVPVECTRDNPDPACDTNNVVITVVCDAECLAGEVPPACDRANSDPTCDVNPGTIDITCDVACLANDPGVTKGDLPHTGMGAGGLLVASVLVLIGATLRRLAKGAT